MYCDRAMARVLKAMVLMLDMGQGSGTFTLPSKGTDIPLESDHHGYVSLREQTEDVVKFEKLILTCATR